MRETGFDLVHSLLCIVYFHDQLIKTIVVQFDDDCLFRIVDVPEDAPALLIEGSRCQHPRQIRPGKLESAPPAGSGLRIVTNMGQRNVQLTLEGPQFVHPQDLQMQVILKKINHYSSIIFRFSSERANSLTEYRRYRRHRPDRSVTRPMICWNTSGFLR
jgi:hypothetical protein